VARITSGTLVSGLTAAAVAAVLVLAVQAAGSPADRSSGAAASPSATSAAVAPPPGSAAARHPLPARSGVGQRVVYSVSRARVWLVGDNDRVLRTYPVVSGDIAPGRGTHRVFARRAQGTGGDGTHVDYVVLFASAGGTNVGFSAAANGSMAAPDPGKRTAAIRESRDDALALWQTATIGTTVEVVR
jgi:hypothetical protein